MRSDAFYVWCVARPISLPHLATLDNFIFAQKGGPEEARQVPERGPQGQLVFADCLRLYNATAARMGRIWAISIAAVRRIPLHPALCAYCSCPIKTECYCVFTNYLNLMK